MVFKSRLDESIDKNDEYRYRFRIRDFVQKMVKQSNFRYEEIEHLCLLHNKLKDSRFGISRGKFLDFLHIQFGMHDNFLFPYILNALTGDVAKYINNEQFIRILSLILCGSLEDKIQYCYRVFANSDNMITRKRALYLMERSFWYISEKHDLSDVKDLVDLLFRKVDLNRDGIITFEEYKSFVLNKPESLEMFGSCLPSRTLVYAFLSTINSNVTKL